MRRCAVHALVILALGGGSLSASEAQAVQAAGSPEQVQVADKDRIASKAALQVWTWVIASRDNGDLPFIIEIGGVQSSVNAFLAVKR